MSDEQFLTSPFLPRFHLFSHKLKFFRPLRTPGPRGTCPGYPPPLSVGLSLDTLIQLVRNVGEWTENLILMILPKRNKISLYSSDL